MTRKQQGSHFPG